MLIRAGDTLSTSVWDTTDSGMVLDNDGNSGFDTWVRVTGVSATAKYFSIRNVVTVTRTDGKVEEFNRTLKIKIKEQ